MTTLRSQVTEFHKAFGQPIVDKPKVPSDERVRLRLRLIAEEFCELLDASGYQGAWLGLLKAELRKCIDADRIRVDLVAFTDALADLDYVIEGTRLEFGIDGAPIAAEVHRANREKLGPDGNPVVRTDGKVIKPKGWRPPDIEGELRKQGWQP